MDGYLARRAPGPDPERKTAMHPGPPWKNTRNRKITLRHRINHPHPPVYLSPSVLLTFEFFSTRDESPHFVTSASFASSAVKRCLVAARSRRISQRSPGWLRSLTLLLKNSRSFARFASFASDFLFLRASVPPC